MGRLPGCTPSFLLSPVPLTRTVLWVLYSSNTMGRLPATALSLSAVTALTHCCGYCHPTALTRWVGSLQLSLSISLSLLALTALIHCCGSVLSSYSSNTMGRLPATSLSLSCNSSNTLLWVLSSYSSNTMGRLPAPVLPKSNTAQPKKQNKKQVCLGVSSHFSSFFTV